MQVHWSWYGLHANKERRSGRGLLWRPDNSIRSDWLDTCIRWRGEQTNVEIDILGLHGAVLRVPGTGAKYESNSATKQLKIYGIPRSIWISQSLSSSQLQQQLPHSPFVYQLALDPEQSCVRPSSRVVFFVPRGAHPGSCEHCGAAS